MKVKNLLVLLGLVSAIFTSHAPTPVVAQVTPTREVTNAHNYTVQWTNNNFGNYYESINFNSNIATQISSLITSTHKTNTTYDGLKDLFKVSDKDPNKSGNILWFYTGTSVPFSAFGSSVGTTNREHVFPKNAGNAFPEKSGPGSDGHHLRPTEAQMNSTRGSKSFGEVPQTTSNIVKEGGSTSYHSDPDKLCYTNSSFFYPGKGYRGQTARILFYVVSRWGGEYNLKFVSGSGSNKTIGDITTLLKWNLEEPVTQTEITRNEVVYGKQGNRNPFIDNPYLACAIWGGFNSETQNMCSQYSSIVNPYTGDSSNPSVPDSGGNQGGTTTPTVNWGTSLNPITTAAAVENMKNFSDKQTSDSSGYVKGIVTEVSEISSEYKNITLTLDNKLIVFRAKTPNNTYDSSNPEVEVGDEIVVTGTFQKYGTKDELINGTIVSVKQGSSVSPDNPGGGTDTPDNPGGNTPSNPGGGVVVESEEISFDFASVGLEQCSYTSEVTVDINNLEYYFSDIYVGAHSDSQVVRLGSKGSSAIQDLGLSGQGSYLEPKFDIENCSSIELDISSTYSNTTGYAILFRDKDTGQYEVLKEGGLSGATTLSYKLSEPRDGNFVIAIKGSQARADLGQLTIKSEGVKIDLSGLKLEASTYVKDETSYLQFEADFDKNYFTGSTKFGVLVFSKNQLGSSNISDLYTEGNLSSFKSSISKYTILDFDFTNDKIESNGKYLYGCAITNVSGHEDYQFVAVSYIEISGKLYFTTEITASVNSCK